MPVPNIDFNDTAVNLLPSEQRETKWIITARALVSQVVRLYGIFKGFIKGEALDTYDPLETYLIGATVQYNFKTWESLINNNTGNQPDIGVPAWILRNNSFIGATERTKYNGRYLELTYALNRYFNQQLTENGFTGFRQPPYPAPYDYGLGGGTFSDIYIANVEPTFLSFVVGATAGNSSDIFSENSTGYVFATSVFGTGTTYGFAVNIPLSVYNSLGTTNTIRASIVSGFVNKYIVSGTNFIIIAY